MAASLEDEVKRKRAAAALLDNGDDGSGDDTEADVSTDLPEDVTDTSEEETSQSSRPIYAPATKKGPSYVLVPLSQATEAREAAPDTSGHIDLAPPRQTPTPEATTYPTIAEDQPGAAETSLKIPTPTPESPSGPTNIQTDPETGARYVTDPDTGQMVPHAELATPADREAFKPSDVTLPSRTVEGTAETQPAPDKLTQVERGQLVSTPPGTAPKAVGVAAPVTYPTIAEDQGAPGTPPKVQAAQPVTPTAPKPVTGELAEGPPGTHPDGTQNEPYWPKRPEQVSQLPPGSVYIDPTDGSVKTTPGKAVAPAISSLSAQPIAPKPRASQFGLTPDEYKASLTEQPATTTQATAPPDASGLNINTDYTADSNSFHPGRGGDGKVHGIVLHSTDASEKSSLETLTHGGVSAHYLVNEVGKIYNLVPDGDTAYHAGVTTGPHAGYNNSNTIGIEQVHVDGKPWAPAQVAATARLVAHLEAKYGVSNDSVMGHSDVAPGRKQDPLNYPWEGFFAAVDKQGGAAPATAQAGVPGAAATAPAGATAAASGTQGYISGKATTFGYKDPDDNGVGAPKLGGLSTDNTDLIGIAVPEQALRSYVSAHPADWRKARVDVVTKDGRHVLVPIVDLGPRDTSGAVAADFTQGLTNLTGNTGDQNYQFKIIPNAGPDVMKNPQEFADEQAAIRAGINTGARFQPKPAARPSYVLAPLKQSPAESVAADTAKQYDQQSQMDTLTQLSDSTPNVVGLYKSLDKDVPGVTPAMRQQFQSNLKPQIIGLMKQKYPDLSDDDAWAKAQTDPNALDVGADFWNKFVGSFQQLSPLLQQATGVQAEQSHVNAFLDQALPKGSDADKHALLTKLYAMPQEQRGPYVASLIPNPQTGVPGQDPQEVVSALDRLSDPNYAKQQAAQMAQAQAALKQRMATDPRLVGTPAAFASENLAQIPEMIAAAGIPPLMAAQIGQQLREQMKAEHPEYSEDELDQKAAYGTLVQLVGQEAAGRLFGAGTGALMQGIKSPVKRAIAQALTNTGLGAGISGGTQALTNVVTGEPPGQGVAAATVGGALQGGVTGAVHAGGELLHPAPEAPTKAPLGQEPITPPPETGPAGGAVRGAEQRTLTGAEEGTPLQPPTPLTSTSVLGPDVPDTSVPWYKPGPVVTRPGVERTTFTPEELTAATSTLPANATPQELAAAAARLRPPENFGRQAVALGEEGNVEAAQTRAMQARWAQPDLAAKIDQTPLMPRTGLHPDNNIQVGVNPSTGNFNVYLYGKEGSRGVLPLGDGVTRGEAEALAENLRQRGTGGQYVDPGDLNKAINVARISGQSVKEARETAINAIFEPAEASPSPPPPRPGNINGEDHHVAREANKTTVNGVANIYQKARTASGELPPIDPNIGVTTEELLVRGARMSPGEINQHVSDLMDGKVSHPAEMAAAVRVKERELTQRSRQLGIQSEENPSDSQLKLDANNALKKLVDFHSDGGPIKKMKEIFNHIGVGLQGDLQYDLSSENGLKEKYFEETKGKNSPPSADPQIKAMAKQVRQIHSDEYKAKSELSRQVDKWTRGKMNDAKIEEIRQAGLKKMNVPC